MPSMDQMMGTSSTYSTYEQTTTTTTTRNDMGTYSAATDYTSGAGGFDYGGGDGGGCDATSKDETAIMQQVHHEVLTLEREYDDLRRQLDGKNEELKTLKTDKAQRRRDLRSSDGTSGQMMDMMQSLRDLQVEVQKVRKCIASLPLFPRRRSPLPAIGKLACALAGLARKSRARRKDRQLQALHLEDRPRGSSIARGAP